MPSPLLLWAVRPLHCGLVLQHSLYNKWRQIHLLTWMDGGLLLGRCLELTNKGNILSSSGGQNRSYDERVRHSTSSCDMDG